MKHQLMLILLATTLTGCESTNNNLMGSLDSVTNSINSTLESVENSINGTADTLISSSKAFLSSSDEEMNSSLEQIIPNLTTSQEVEFLIGSPISKSRANGTIIWHYANADIEFNSKGVVTTTKLI